MPQKGQKSVTISLDTWETAVEYFEKHKNKLRIKGIKSPTGLITRWILEASEKQPDKNSS